MKGISPLLSGTLFILITVVVATLVAGWLTVLSEERSESLQNTTGQRLRCEYADLFIDNIHYNCNNNCFTGVPYGLNATIKNGGSVGSEFSQANLIYKDGAIVKLATSKSSISGGSTKNTDFNDILIFSEPAIPAAITPRAPLLDHDTRGLWRFNEASGNTTVDETVYSNDGYIKDALWRDGMFDAALLFNQSAYVNVQKSESIDITGNITIEAWIKPSVVLQERGGILCKGRDDYESYCLLFDNGAITFFVRDSSGDVYNAFSVNTIQDTNWHHVAGVYDSQKVSVYLDYIKTEGDAFSDAVRISLNNLTIGNKETVPDTFTTGFEGLIDEVRLSNISRSFTDPNTITTINLTYVLNHPEMRTATLYNSQNEAVASDTINADYFERTVQDLFVDEYRVVVVSSDGTAEKWYPSESGQCIPTSSLDRITITSMNCPATAFDSIPGPEVMFVDCV